MSILVKLGSRREKQFCNEACLHLTTYPGVEHTDYLDFLLFYRKLMAGFNSALQGLNFGRLTVLFAAICRSSKEPTSPTSWELKALPQSHVTCQLGVCSAEEVNLQAKRQ